MPNEDLYKQKIIDHYKNPRNFGEMDNPDFNAHVNNPVCGDEVTFYLKVEDGKIVDVKYKGSGCAISMAGSSMLTEELKGKTVDEVKKLGPDYMLNLIGVDRKSPRVKCALLGFDAAKRAVESGKDDPCDFC